MVYGRAAAFSPYRIALRRMFGVRHGEITVVDWFDRAPIDFLNVIAFQNPISSQGRKPLNWVERHCPSRIGSIISPGTAGVVNPNRFVGFNLAGHGFGGRETYFAEGDANLRMNFPRDVNLFGIR